MPLVAVALVARGRHRRPSTRLVAVAAPPLWPLLYEEFVVAARTAASAIRNRFTNRRT